MSAEPTTRIAAPGTRPAEIARGEHEERAAAQFVREMFTGIAGRYDLLAEDGNGNTYIVDCKTASMAEDKADRYRMQLSAYARIFEDPHPEDGREPVKISGIGLLIHHPQGFLRAPESERDNYDHIFHLKSHFLPVERDDAALLVQAKRIAQTLEQDGYPELDPECPDCKREAFGAGRVLTE